MLLLFLLALPAGCAKPQPEALEPLPPPAENVAAAPRVAGSIAPPAALPRASASYGVAAAVPFEPGPGGAGGGEYSLEFADTDVREAIAQIVGGMLKQTYTIDPAVHGTVTLHTPGRCRGPS